MKIYGSLIVFLLTLAPRSVGAGDFEAEYLHYVDTDNNQKIDTLWIDYGRILTGSLDLGKLQLYSASGGLSSRLIDTYRNPEALILTGSLVGTKLIVRILEGDLPNTQLHVSERTSSHLRLRCAGDLGIRDLNGDLAKNINYSKSFGKYTQVAFGETRQTWTSQESSPSVDTLKETIELKPQISLQSKLNEFMTYSGDTLVCEGTCKINFDGSQSEGGKGAEFVWDFSDGTTHEGDNPPSHTFASGSFLVSLTMTKQGLSKTTYFPLTVVGVTLESTDDYEVPKSSGPQSFPQQVDALPLWQQILLSVSIFFLFLSIGLFILKKRDFW